MKSASASRTRATRRAYGTRLGLPGSSAGDASHRGARDISITETTELHVAIDGRPHDIGTLRDARARAPRTRVRSWTGRAAMSLMTDSAVPTLVLAGTRRTRVSEMRLPARTAPFRRPTESADPGPFAFLRRRRRAVALQPTRWSG